MKRIFASLFMFVFLTALSGCAKLAHMDQLLTLKALSEEKDRMDKHVEKQDQLFEEMVGVVESGEIKNYSNKKSIAKKFGQPISVSQVPRDNQSLDLWVYRYSVKFFDSDKVYLYFEPEHGKLMDWEYIKEGPAIQQPAS